MIRSVLAAIGLTIVLICFINVLWLMHHHQPLTLTAVTSIESVVQHAQEIFREIRIGN